VNLLPLCRRRQALPGAAAPRKKIRANSSPAGFAGQRLAERKTCESERDSQYGPVARDRLWYPADPPGLPGLTSTPLPPEPRRIAPFRATQTEP
jgi:hypothetical protein